MPIRLTQEQFIERAIQKHGNQYSYDLVKYINSATKVSIFCKKHNEVFYQKANDHLLGRRCKKCGYDIVTQKQTGNGEDFIKKAIEIHGIDKYDYSLVNYIMANRKVIIICKKHGAFEQTPSSHLSSNGCPKCNNERTGDKFRKGKLKFIEDAIKVHGKKYDYSLVEYINTITNVFIKCKKHNYLFEQVPSSHLGGNGCKKCTASKGETFIDVWLTNNQIPFIIEKTFPTCKSIQVLQFDFYLPTKNILIEFDGQQHFKPFGKGRFGTKVFETTQKHDKIKNEWALKNGIELIRIPYTQIKNIPSILKNVLFPVYLRSVNNTDRDYIS